jgi:hypothetical protein
MLLSIFEGSKISTMFNIYGKRLLLAGIVMFVSGSFILAQNSVKLKYKKSAVYAGIEVGSKGVKMSILEISKDPQSGDAFNILRDTSVNTDFISFTEPTFKATLNAFHGLYNSAQNDYAIKSSMIYTVISSGVKVRAEKEDKTRWIYNLIDSFRRRVNEPQRKVEVIDPLSEARLSHLGIVPESKRFTTFLVDIGSGNTKGGYFPNGNTTDFNLFNLNWGTKSVANETEKRTEDDKTLANYNRQLWRVLKGIENTEVVYAVNKSGAYDMNDNVGFSGGIAWALGTLIHPEQIDKPIVWVTYEDVENFVNKVYGDSVSLTVNAIVRRVKDDNVDIDAVAKEVKRVHSVFDRRSLMSGTGLMLKIMRQFKSIYETKQFFITKNGQVGWISAYVDSKEK